MKFTVYDFDKTIYNGDSTIAFIKFLINKDKSILLHTPKMFLYLIKYKLKIIEKEEMKECFFEIFKKFKNMDKLVEEFWDTHEKNIKDFFKNKKSHKKDIISSASPYFLLEPIAKKYEVYDLFASPVNKKNGKYKGKNCHGVEKVRLLHKKYPGCVVMEMYSDDINADKPLLELAKKSYVVKKDEIIDYKEYLKIKPNLLKRFWNWGWRIYHKNEELWNYLIVGVLTTIVSIATYYICVRTFLNPKIPIELQIANIISWIFAVIFAYITNRIFVFKSKSKKIFKEISSFVGSRIITLLLDMLCMFIIVTLLGLYDLIGKIVSQVVVTIGNYIISKLFVFKKKD